MKLAAIGPAVRLEALRNQTGHPLLGAEVEYLVLPETWEPGTVASLVGGDQYDALVVFPSAASGYLPTALHLPPQVPVVLVGLLGCSGAEACHGFQSTGNLFVFNDLEGFWQRPEWELAPANPAIDKAVLAPFEAMGLRFDWVPDRPGLVTPRVLVQLVNEAYFLAGEGGAEPSDIDLAMRLGVNYPQGPFAWAQQLGARTVVAVLRSLQRYAGADAYRPAPALLAAAFEQAS